MFRQDVHQFFVRTSMKNGVYVANLSLLIAVLMPIAHAITCLESTHSTVADVFLFWLAVMAQFDNLLTSPDSDDLVPSDKEHIRRILNYRWQQMIVLPSTNGPAETVSVYVVGFLLHPGTCFFHNILISLLTVPKDIVIVSEPFGSRR